MTLSDELAALRRIANFRQETAPAQVDFHDARLTSMPFYSANRWYLVDGSAFSAASDLELYLSWDAAFEKTIIGRYVQAWQIAPFDRQPDKMIRLLVGVGAHKSILTSSLQDADTSKALILPPELRFLSTSKHWKRFR